MEKNQIFQQGVYLDWEKKQVLQRVEYARAFVFEKPGTDEPFETVMERDVLAFNGCWNPFDRLYNDPEYAKAQGLPGVPAMPGFAHRKLNVKAAKDLRLDRTIADSFYFTAIGGDIYYKSRLCAGDKALKTQIRSVMSDITKTGSDLRVFDFEKVTGAFNNKGDMIDESHIYTREGYRKYLDGRPSMNYTENMTQWEADFPPAHITTDEDYLRMRSIWDEEVIRGEEPLYWEDVQVGAEMPKTCSDGPITYMHIAAWEPISPSALITREMLMDMDYRRTAYRDRFGSFMTETAIHFGGRNNTGTRMVFYNTDAAFLVARTVTNFIGNAGRISRFGWRLYPLNEEMRLEKLGAEMFDKIPGMEGRYCNRHGAESDTVIGRAVVTGKYINEKDEHCIEIALWAETLDGDVIQACPCEAVLPSNKH